MIGCGETDCPQTGSPAISTPIGSARVNRLLLSPANGKGVDELPCLPLPPSRRTGGDARVGTKFQLLCLDELELYVPVYRGLISEFIEMDYQTMNSEFSLGYAPAVTVEAITSIVYSKATLFQTGITLTPLT